VRGEADGPREEEKLRVRNHGIITSYDRVKERERVAYAVLPVHLHHAPDGQIFTLSVSL
jgi:hypothetical protein